MRIKIKKEKRMSIAYQLSPYELTVAVPDSISTSVVGMLESAGPNSTADLGSPISLEATQSDLCRPSLFRHRELELCRSRVVGVLAYIGMVA